ncbi:MAG: FtsX-like permease family protein [Dehalococcoidia bacterium]|nr:FtsX-like permease family protein [Dehalococcoidia bacterium]
MLGLREIWRRRTTFVLIGLVVALVSYLVLMINALGLGLQDEFGSAVKRFDADAIAFDDGARLAINRSELSESSVEAIRSQATEERSAPLGFLMTDYRSGDGEVLATSIFGYDPGTIAEPQPIAGRPLTDADARGLLVDRQFLADSSAVIGDSVTILRDLRAEQFEIVGVIDGGSFAFLPVAYMLRSSWQDLRYPQGDGDVVPAASIVLMQGTDLVDTEAGSGFVLASKDEAFANIEGLADMQGTIWALRFFGYAISAGVVGVFFYVLTLQKVSNIGLLKALGASSGFVAGQTLLQAGVIVVAGLAIATLWAGLTASALGGGGIPIVLTGTVYLTSGVSLVVTALLAVLFSIRSIMRVDPIIALAQQH